MDKKEELKKDFSQEKWFTQLNMSDALVASFRIEREEKKKAKTNKKDSGKKLGREGRAPHFPIRQASLSPCLCPALGNQRPRQPHWDPQHNCLLGSEQG